MVSIPPVGRLGNAGQPAPDGTGGTSPGESGSLSPNLSAAAESSSGIVGGDVPQHGLGGLGRWSPGAERLGGGQTASTLALWWRAGTGTLCRTKTVAFWRTGCEVAMPVDETLPRSSHWHFSFSLSGIGPRRPIEMRSDCRRRYRGVNSQNRAPVERRKCRLKNFWWRWPCWP